MNDQRGQRRWLAGAVTATLIGLAALAIFTVWGAAAPSAEAQQQEPANVTICVTKVFTASTPPDNDLTPFDIDLNTSDFGRIATGVFVPAGQDGGCSAEQPSVLFEETIEPGLDGLPTLTLLETLTDGPVRPIEFTCTDGGTPIDERSVELDSQFYSNVQGTIFCSVTNSAVRVCAVKALNSAASEAGFGPADFSISFTDGNGLSGTEAFEPLPDTPDQGQSACVADSAAGQAEFYLPPATGARTLTFSEPAVDGPVSLVAASCTYQEPNDEPVSAGLNDNGQVVLALDSSRAGSIDCRFENATTSVCVAKDLRLDADRAGDSETDFGFRLDDGPAQAPGPECHPDLLSVRYFVAPGSTFTITEVPSDTAISRTTAIACEQERIDGPAVIIGEPNVPQGSVTIDVPPRDAQPITCVFTNDVMVVCVYKRLRGDAPDIADVDDFTFDLTVSGEPTQVLVPSTDDTYCGGIEGSNLGVVGAALTPGTVFSLTERPTDPRIGLLSADCEAGEYEVSAEAGSRTIADISPPLDTRRIECDFRNGSVLVCVTKRLAKAADEFGLTPGTFDVSVNGDLVLEGFPPDIGDEGDLCANGEDRRFGFYAPPGASVILTESLAGSPLGIISGDCFAGEGDLSTSLDGNSLSFDLEAGATNQAICTITNDVASVCVVKQVGEGAFLTGSSPTDFTFTVTADGVDMPSVDGQCADAENPGQTSTRFLVPPGSTFTVTEDAVEGPVSVVDVQCVVRDVDGPGSTTVEGDVASRSVTVDLVDRELVDCSFTNDVSAVCATKVVGSNAEAAGFSAADFSFAIEVDSGTVAPGPDDLCAIDSDEPVVATGWLIPPAVTFTITESHTLGAAAPIGMVDGECQFTEAPTSVDLDAGTISVTLDGSDFVFCTFTNDTAVVCVAKRLDTGAVAAGYTVSDFSFQLSADGDAVGDPVVPSPAAEGDTCTSDQDGAGLATLLVSPRASTLAVTEIVGDGVRAGVGSARCESTSTFGESTVSFSPGSDTDNGTDTDTESSLVYDCDFFNLSIPVTINKTVINDNAGVLGVADFVFDVFDADGELIASVSDPDAGAAGAVVYVAPGSSFTVTEREAEGYSTTSASCNASSFDQALAGTSVTYELGDAELSVECVFVNDDTPPIPVCAMLTLDEGDSDFTLADFNLELFKDGAIIGQRTADEPFDAECEDTSDDTAGALAGNLVLLAEVFADDEPLTFVVSADDPDRQLIFEPSSCTTDDDGAVQALRGPDPVTFTVEPDDDRVICVAQASVTPPRNTVSTAGSRPTFISEEPVVTTAAAAPVTTQPAQVVATTAIAVTGSSTTDVTVPIGLSLVATGFLGLGIARMRRRNRD